MSGIGIFVGTDEKLAYDIFPDKDSCLAICCRPDVRLRFKDCEPYSELDRFILDFLNSLECLGNVALFVATPVFCAVADLCRFSISWRLQTLSPSVFRRASALHPYTSQVLLLGENLTDSSGAAALEGLTLSVDLGDGLESGELLSMTFCQEDLLLVLVLVLVLALVLMLLPHRKHRHRGLRSIRSAISSSVISTEIKVYKANIYLHDVLHSQMCNRYQLNEISVTNRLMR